MQRTAKTISRVVLGITLGTGLGISVQSADVMAAPQGGDRPALRDGSERGPRGARDGDRPGGREGRPGGGERGGGERGAGARGGPGGRGGPEMMMRMPIIVALDADQDGVISSKEIKNAAAALATLDKNKDGELVLSELVPDFGGRGRGGPGASGPGTRGQGAGGPGGERPGDKGFGDRGPAGRGPGDRAPGARASGARGPGARPSGARGPAGDRGRPDMEGGADAGSREGRGRGNPEEMLARLMEQDKDGDGMLTKEELPGFMSRMMERADTDGDSRLSPEELESAMSKMRRGGGAGAGGRGGDRGGSQDAAGGEKPRRPPSE